MNSNCVGVVMLIDDNEIDGFINQKVIEFDDFAEKILVYYSAREALDFLQTAEIGDVPDMIFLDLNMPVVDGFRFLSEFTHFPKEVREKSTVIVLTSSENVSDKEKALTNPDVLHFLSKPLNEDKLHSVRDLLKKSAK